MYVCPSAIEKDNNAKCRTLFVARNITAKSPTIRSYVCDMCCDDPARQGQRRRPDEGSSSMSRNCLGKSRLVFIWGSSDITLQLRVSVQLVPVQRAYV